jgi:hypothetical protein
MATGHKSFSVVVECKSPVPCEIGAAMWPRDGYQELPVLSGNPGPFSTDLHNKTQRWEYAVTLSTGIHYRGHCSLHVLPKSA